MNKYRLLTPLLILIFTILLAETCSFLGLITWRFYVKEMSYSEVKGAIFEDVTNIWNKKSEIYVCGKCGNICKIKWNITSLQGVWLLQLSRNQLAILTAAAKFLETLFCWCAPIYLVWGGMSSMFFTSAWSSSRR